MPVIVVGADTPIGREIVSSLLPRDGEVRVFVTDEDAARSFRTAGAKVAIGDISDGTHVGGAALNAFSAVLVGSAATDDRVRSFAATPAEVVDAWAEGLADAGVQRIILVATPGTEATDDLASAAREFAVVAAGPDTAARVAALDEAERV